MRSRALLAVLWLGATVVAATVAWQSLTFVSASTESGVAAPTLPTADRSNATTPVPVEVTPTLAEGPTGTTADSPRSADDTGGTTTGVSAAAPEPASDPVPVEETFDLIGGQVAIRFTPTEVGVLWITPAPGYTGSSQPEDGGVEVEFDNGVHESKLEAWWDGGPRTEIREEDD